MKPVQLTIALVVFGVATTFAQTNVWTGCEDTDWHKSTNWSLGTLPTCATDVEIPNVTNDPLITGVAHCKTIDIKTDLGAELTINSSGSGILYIEDKVHSEGSLNIPACSVKGSKPVFVPNPNSLA